MKNKLMQRPMLSGMVRQRIDNEMLCLTDLAQIYEIERIENGWVEKRLDHFFNRDSEIEYIIELLDLQGTFVNVQKHTFTEQVKIQGLIKALKTIGQYETKGRGANKAVFCNPYIFIAIAQWLNPRFRAYVTVWATDSLILNRIDAGSQYNELCSVLKDKILINLPEESNQRKFLFSNFAKLINKKVFGKHEADLRQMANKNELLKLTKIESELSALIKVGYISSYQDAKDYLEL